MARQSIGSLLTKLFRLGCGFLFAVLAARLLGAHGYGIVAVAISLATVIATLALFGTNELAVREVALVSARKSWNELTVFALWAMRTVIIVSVVSAFAMAGASLLPGPYQRALLLGSLAVPLFALHLLLRGLILGSGSVVAAQIPMDVVRWIVTSLLIGLLFLGRWAVTPSLVIFVVVIALATSLAVSAVILGRYLSRLPRTRAEATNQAQWLAQSLPFLAIALFGILGTEIGTLLLGWLSGPREAGLYQPIAKLAPLMMLANEAIETALAPKIVHSWEEDDQVALQRRVGRSALASALATTTIVAAIVIASPYILRAFGPEFIRYQWLIVWIGIAQVVNAATGAAPLLLAMTGDMKSRIGAQAVTMVVQVGLGLALIPAFGAPGAVAALTAAILVWSILHWWLALRATGIDTSLLAIFSRRRRTA